MSRPALYWHADGTLTSAGGTVIEQDVTLDEAGSLYVDETITVTLRRSSPTSFAPAPSSPTRRE